MVVAVGSSHAAANARTATVAATLTRRHRLAGARSRSPPVRSPTLAEAADAAAARGATRLVIAPWFLAHGRITDRVAELRARATASRWPSRSGAHRLVAATVLDRFDARHWPPGSPR